MQWFTTRIVYINCCFFSCNCSLQKLENCRENVQCYIYNELLPLTIPSIEFWEFCSGVCAIQIYKTCLLFLSDSSVLSCPIRSWRASASSTLLGSCLEPNREWAEVRPTRETLQYFTVNCYSSNVLTKIQLYINLNWILCSSLLSQMCFNVCGHLTGITTATSLHF